MFILIKYTNFMVAWTLDRWQQQTLLPFPKDRFLLQNHKPTKPVNSTKLWTLDFPWKGCKLHAQVSCSSPPPHPPNNILLLPVACPMSSPPSSNTVDEWHYKKPSYLTTQVDQHWRGLDQHLFYLSPFTWVLSDVVLKLSQMLNFGVPYAFLQQSIPTTWRLAHFPLCVWNNTALK